MHSIRAFKIKNFNLYVFLLRGVDFMVKVDLKDAYFTVDVKSIHYVNFPVFLGGTEFLNFVEWHLVSPVPLAFSPN